MRSANRNLKDAGSGAENEKKVATIASLAKEVCGNGGLTYQHPVDL